MMETTLEKEKQTVLNIFRLVKESWLKDEDPTEMIKKTAEVAGVSMATVYDIIKEDQTKNEAPTFRKQKHKKNCTLKIKDQTKIDITKVYHFLRREYEELKKRYVGLDLTYLSKFSQRTALATGVSESLVLEIVQEEESQNIDMQREQLQKQSLARKRSEQTESSSEEDGFESNDEQSSTVHGLSNTDQTKIDIAKVYHYFKQECEVLKRKYVGLGLTPLMNCRQRTALATGVSESTVVEILQEQRRRNADMRQEQLWKQSLAGVKEKPLETLQIEMVFVKDEHLETYDTNEILDTQPASKRKRTNILTESGVTCTQLVIHNIEDLPEGCLLESPLHPKRRRLRQPPTTGAPAPPQPRPLSPPLPIGGDGDGNGRMMGDAHSALDYDSDDEVAPPGALLSPAVSVPSPAALFGCRQASTPTASPSTSSSMRPPPPHCSPRQNLRELINVGSDEGSDESGDEEEVPPLMIPRELRTMISWDQDDEDDEVSGDGGVDIAAVDPRDAALGAGSAAPAGSVGPAHAADFEAIATEQPCSFLDFDWRSFPNSSIPPASRREPFSQINVGPTIPDVDPYSIFIAIWDRQFMEYIASETNKYAGQVKAQKLAEDNLHPQSRIRRWHDTTADELYVFFALILAMGVVGKSSLSEYWSISADVFATPGFSAYMSINRFILLNRFLHFADNNDMGALNREVSEARLFKIRPVLSHLNLKFSHLYVLSQNLALDESLLMWKGPLDIVQLIPNKAASKGIKTYELCESQTGYLWRFEIHSHKAVARQPEPENPLEKTTPAIVLRLTQGLEHKGYTLWMDNFYNSPVLARRLKCLGFDCVGTLRTNRQFVPEALHNLTKQHMRRGQVSGLTSGDVDVMVWKDCNRVATISTYHGNAVQDYRGATKPILIHDYNIMMGGVDKKDQMLSMYPIERKRTNVWYKKVFRRLLNVSVLNSHIMHRSNALASATPSLSHRLFRISLIKTLLSRHGTVRSLPVPQNMLHDVTHRSALYPKTANNVRRQRRTCGVCRKVVQSFCVACQKACCLDTCFLALHTRV